MGVTDPTLAPSPPAYASRRRLLLAAYLDFCLFGAVWGVVLHFAPRPFDQPFLDFVAFIPLELLLFHTGRSPGQRMLGVRRVDPETHADPGAPQRSRSVHLVDPTILTHERWFTIALGVLLVNDGSKGLVRWTQWHVPEPWFGVVHGPAADVALRVAFGVTTIACAWGVLQLRRWALPAMLTLIVAMGASVALGWGMWDDWAARETAARSAWQGRALDPARVQAMQSIVPELLVVWLAGLLAATLLAARRFVR